MFVKKRDPLKEKYKPSIEAGYDKMLLLHGKRARFFSRLRLRILTVNIIPVIVLLVGVLYLGQYERSIVEAELKTLKNQATLYAETIAETTIRPQAIQKFSDQPMDFEVVESLSVPLARRLLQRLGSMTQSRIRLYDIERGLIADSDMLQPGGGLINAVPLEPMEERSLRDIGAVFEWAADHLPRLLNLSEYPEESVQYGFPNMGRVMAGQSDAQAWLTKNEGIILSAAAPVQNLKQVKGAVFLTQDGSQIQDALDQVTVNILSIFGMTIAVTLILSLYLAAGIANPLKKLARGSAQVRSGKINVEKIPNFSKRRDEIGDLSVALRDMTTALAQRIDSIERFAADVAHEIKNPLTSLRSAVETASIVTNRKDQERLFEIILHDVQRIDRLISDISNASRLDAELAREVLGRVDLRALLSFVRDNASLVHKSRLLDDEQHNILVSLHFPDETMPVIVQGIEGRLGQVFTNLIENALSFSPEGESVNVYVSRDGPVWIISVEDSGPGIPENKLNDVFERFYSERPKGDAFGNHSGLGLSISKQIIDAHQGRIFAENIIDDNGQKSGARFTVILYAAD
jgi:two-component system sensor histidine kinase ChvG